jgi:hypothetical protein
MMNASPRGFSHVMGSRNLSNDQTGQFLGAWDGETPSVIIAARKDDNLVAVGTTGAKSIFIIIPTPMFNFSPTRLFSSLLLLTTVSALAQTDDILANTATFKPKITVSDVYSEKVLIEADDDFVFRSVEANPERIALTVVANLVGANVGTIDADTEVGVTAGNFSHSDSLGSAPDYKPTSKKATFPITMDVDLPNGNTVTRTVGSVIYAWTPKQLTVTVTCSNVAGAGISDISASNYAGTAEAGTTVFFANDPIDVSVNFGDAAGGRRAFLKGTTRTQTKNYGSVDDGTDESYDISDVNLTGAADVIAPVVKTIFPAKPAAGNTITVAGTAVDIEEVSVDSVTVNGVDDTSATVAISDDDENGSWDWSVTGLQLKKGANAIIITFTDEDGNLTQLKKSYTVK